MAKTKRVGLSTSNTVQRLKISRRSKRHASQQTAPSVLNEKLGIASDFLDAIHEHLNNSAMERITWIVIWLIVVAIVVDLGEVVARLIFHAALDNAPTLKVAPSISKEEVLYTLDRMASS
ncbi:hypothetical protein ARMSODRAFT_1005307 [Armillaria solidipes]|uniref:Uncharacterized protein n=1 Tax=Armillaria solidipes TaxID=1076256 RepID=A0A2H3BK65_9AGAR|nr:hypothetical protein ARMSODRAFT_1005307 [Armillaria solidipes]